MPEPSYDYLVEVTYLNDVTPGAFSRYPTLTAALVGAAVDRQLGLPIESILIQHSPLPRLLNPEVQPSQSSSTTIVPAGFDDHPAAWTCALCQAVRTTLVQLLQHVQSRHGTSPDPSALSRPSDRSADSPPSSSPEPPRACLASFSGVGPTGLPIHSVCSRSPNHDGPHRGIRTTGESFSWSPAPPDVETPQPLGPES